MSEILAPTRLDEYFDLLQRYPGAQPMAGGTDLLVRRRADLPASAAALIALAGIEELRGLREDEHGLSIGALRTRARRIFSGRCRSPRPIPTNR